jgi:hypothetical protein
VINHPDFGWQAFGGNILSKASTIQVEAVDAVRRRVFIATLGTLFSLDAGAFDTIQLTPSAGSVTFSILPAPAGNSAAAPAPTARITVQQTSQISGVGTVHPQDSSIAMDARAYVVPFVSGKASITFISK